MPRTFASAPTSHVDVAATEPDRTTPHPIVVVLTYVALALLAGLFWQAKSGGYAGAPVSRPMVLIGFGVMVIAGIVGGVVTAIWGRRVGQGWASGLTLSAACLVMGLRLTEKPHLGLGTAALGDALMVVQVAPGGTAETAGLRYGDVVVSVDGRHISTPEALYAYVQGRRVFDVVRMEVARADGTFTEQDVMVGDG